MFRIMIFSDSHGNTEYMKRAIEGVRDIDIIVHLGDMARDIREIVKQYPDYRYETVRGNCDIMDPMEDEVMFEEEGFKFLIVHGHRYSVKTGTENLLSYAEENGIDCVMYGHTHNSECVSRNGVLMINPGCGRSYGASYGIIEIEDGKMRADIIEM